jgi:hypothetical protein
MGMDQFHLSFLIISHLSLFLICHLCAYDPVTLPLIARTQSQMKNVKCQMINGKSNVFAANSSCGLPTAPADCSWFCVWLDQRVAEAAC